MHGLNGGRWGQQAPTSKIRRSTKMTTRRRATVSRRRRQSLNQRPTSPIDDRSGDDGPCCVELSGVTVAWACSTTGSLPFRMSAHGHVCGYAGPRWRHSDEEWKGPDLIEGLDEGGGPGPSLGESQDDCTAAIDEATGECDVTAAGVALLVAASGTIDIKTTVLLTPEEVDAAVKVGGEYRPPGG